MSDPALNTCDCCAGLDAETPVRVDNPPGLPAVAYRVGVHARFKESMLARLSSAELHALAGLGTRDDSDFTIALCDAVATTLDVLSFYQERIANENFLRTATQRRSILELARLIGYELAPGVAASTWLAFGLQEVPGSPALAAGPVTIPIGTRVQSVPGQDELPQTSKRSRPSRHARNGMPYRCRRRLPGTRNTATSACGWPASAPAFSRATSSSSSARTGSTIRHPSDGTSAC